MVLGVEKKSAAQLQDARTMRKIVTIDDHICMAFAGLNADARVLVDMARVEGQSFRLNLDEPVDPEHITKHIAGIQQRYTQSGGRRPFGISTLIAGFTPLGAPYLSQTDPSGNFAEWKANAIGRNAKPTREFLEKNYTGGLDVAGAVKLVVRSLMETVEASGKTVEMAVMEREGGEAMRLLTAEEVEAVVKEVEEEKAAAEASRKGRSGGGGGDIVMS